MRITHPSGQDYDLYPGSEVEITRYNPFFHELGEQSVPISIPASKKNLQILGYPDRLDSVNKQSLRLDTTIQSGSYTIVARQALLSAQRKGAIETSFYINEGAFYEKMTDLTLVEIFEGKKIEFASIDAALSFMDTLLTNEDPRFAVFEVATDNYQLNEIKYYLGKYYLVKEDETEEYIDDVTVKIPKGFYITPFVKVKHVLEEVFSHMGYSLAPSFLDQTPFNKMVFLNDNIDTIVANSINYVDIVPNITVKTLLDVIRKFNMEFIPDEVNKVIHIVPFDDILQKPPYVDITEYAVSIPIVNYHNDYKQLKLTSENLPLPSELSRIISYAATKIRRVIKTGSSGESPLLLKEILALYPTVYVRHHDGSLVRYGVSGNKEIIEKVASLGMPYCDSTNLSIEEYSFPDVVPDIHIANTTYPYVGKGRALQSKITYSNVEYDDEDPATQTSPEELRPILCLYYEQNYPIGTLSNFDMSGNRLWDYSLLWNGEYGIFEKFWRKRDTLLRNSLLNVEFELKLPEDLKLSIPSTRRVTFESQSYLISQLQYSTKNNSIGTCSLLSTKHQKPISEAEPSSGLFRDRTYKWKLNNEYSVVGIPGSPMSYRFPAEPVAYYPPDPTPEQYAAGGKYYERQYTVLYGTIGREEEFKQIGECTLKTWLTPILA